MNRNIGLVFIAFVTLIGADCGTSLGDEAVPWSRFHGADGKGYADGELPDSWSASDYRWRIELPAFDVGSPVVFDGKVFLLASNPAQQKIEVRAVKLATGVELWRKSFSHPKHHLHQRNTYASSTPAVDGDHLFVAWSNPDHTYLKCFDHSGKEVWSRDFGTWQSQHGFGTSPRILGDTVYLFNSQQAEQLKDGDAPGQSRIVAVDRHTGKTKWRTDLQTKRSCYGVPAVYQDASGRTQIIGANTGNGLFGLDAKTGSMLWNLEVFEKRCCSTPLVVGDIAIGTSGSGGGGNHLVAVTIPSKVSQQPRQLYRIDRGAPYVPTAAVKDDKLFLVDDKGIATCIEAKSAQKLWMHRIGGRIGASPIIVGDKMLIVGLDGTATLLRAGDKAEEISQFDLGGPVGATPAFSDGRLLLRIGNELCCL